MPTLSPSQIAVWRKTVISRLPTKGRYQKFYAQLDELFPNWGDVFARQAFFAWAVRPDTVDGACMLDRLFSLWNDPAYASQDFATLLGLFSQASAPTPRFRARAWLGKLLRQREEALIRHSHPTYPVILKRYDLLRSLGEGGQGAVYLTWSREINAVVALKVIRAELSSASEALRAFRREAEVWARLERHPNIVSLKFFDCSSDVLHIAMEYVAGDDHGPSLHDYICNGAVSLAAIVNWFAQISCGLEHAYRHGLAAHRDIKPGNILIGRDKVARITDFGVAIAGFTGSPKPSVAGTPHFMAPEQFDEGVICDIRSDIYSLGATLFYCASNGTPAFQPAMGHPTTAVEVARYFAELESMHRRTAPRPLPTPLWPVIARCLAKDPDRRYQTMAEFREGIAQVVGRREAEVPSRAQSLEDMWALPGRAASLMRLGHHEDAIKLLDRYIAWMPDDNARFDRAVCLERLGRHEEALAIYRRFAEGGDAKSFTNGANCLRHLGRPQDALEFANHAVRLDENEPLGWISLGNAAFAVELWTDAVRAYQTAYRLDPKNPTPLYNLGLAAARTDDLTLAKRAFLAFLQLASDEDNRRHYVSTTLAAWR